jgi:hypothetical protein
MVSLFFWNMNKKHSKDIIVNLASTSRYDVDIIMLAESIIDPAEMLSALNQSGEPYYHYSPNINCKKIQIFTKFSSDFLKIKYETPRLTIRELKLPGKQDIFLAVTHFIDKINYNPDSQHEEAMSLANNIRLIEKEAGHSRTVLVGDLNMSPFEPGVAGAMALHGVMSRNIANKGERTVQGINYPYFYNPMWGMYNDGTHGPPGTYYRSESGHMALFWYMFDQVLIRPALLDYFNCENLHIVDFDGKASFLSTEGLPKASISDHLPIAFKLEI